MHDGADLVTKLSLQMPIRDGYSATHAIRTEAPWRDKPEIQGVPIVAMTASAIQGDKEKCTLAGMDVSLHGTVHYIEELVTDVLQDYLAKPVKGKLLEKVSLLNHMVNVN
jgi:CheY-like chemotaxis protein